MKKSTPPHSVARGLILLAAFASFLLSVGLFFLGDDKLEGIFVGLWVPSILSLGTFIAPWGRG